MFIAGGRTIEVIEAKRRRLYEVVRDYLSRGLNCRITFRDPDHSLVEVSLELRNGFIVACRGVDEYGDLVEGVKCLEVVSDYARSKSGVIEVSQVSLELIERDLSEFPNAVVNHEEAIKAIIGETLIPAKPAPPKPSIPKPSLRLPIRIPLPSLEVRAKPRRVEERPKPKLSSECMDIVTLSRIVLGARIVETRRDVGIDEALDTVIRKSGESNVKYVYAVLESSNERVRIVHDKASNTIYIEYQGGNEHLCGEEALHKAAKKYERIHIAVM